MRPGAGFASHWEITFRFSRLAALYHGRRCRPDMTFWTRLVSPARLYAVRLGRAGVRRVYARGEDQVGIVAPQRTKSSRRSGLTSPGFSLTACMGTRARPLWSAPVMTCFG
jgi:hypothetical protein